MAPNADGADGGAFAQHGNSQHRAGPEPRAQSRVGTPDPPARPGDGLLVVRSPRGPSRCRAREAGKVSRSTAIASPSSPWAATSDQLVVDTRTTALNVGLAEMTSAPRDRVEHGLHISRRARDHAENFAGRRLLRDCALPAL